MSIYLEHRELNGIRLGIWRVEESLQELAEMHPYGARQLQEICAEFSNEKRQLERMVARVLLYQLLGDAKEISYLPSGKPVLVDSPYHVSISHTQGFVAVLLSPYGDCGVDIEQYGPKVERVRERFMHPSEGLMAVSEEMKSWTAEKELAPEILDPLLHWCSKETIYKVLGRSEVDFREHLRVKPFVLHRSGQAEAWVFSKDENEPGTPYRLHYGVTPWYVLTWTALGKDWGDL